MLDNPHVSLLLRPGRTSTRFQKSKSPNKCTSRPITAQRARVVPPSGSTTCCDFWHAPRQGINTQGYITYELQPCSATTSLSLRNSNAPQRNHLGNLKPQRKHASKWSRARVLYLSSRPTQRHQARPNGVRLADLRPQYCTIAIKLQNLTL